VPAWFPERLRHDFPGLEVVQLEDYGRLNDEISNADIVIGWSLRGEQIAAAKKLKWIHSTATAVHALMRPELRASEVVVTNARDVHGPVVAEHAMAMIFALAKRLPQAMQYQQQKHWAQQDLWDAGVPPRELRDSTVCILGLGGIGRPLAKLAKRVGMKVIGVREHAGKHVDNVATIYGFEQLDEGLRQADFVVLALPVTPKTECLMNASRLAQLKHTAYLINVGRGALIDEPSLIEALQRKSFAGAALDVTTREPLPPDSPLWEMDNMLITPHVAGLTDQMWERHYQAFTENLRRFQQNQPLLWVVDKQVGY
jgi:phosphoglycerate dehydrogenase-like enzyme